MEPKITASGSIADSATDEEFLLDEQLSEFEAEDLLGCDIDFDDQDDWRAAEY